MGQVDTSVTAVILDTETGGLDPMKHSLLTGYFAAVTDDLKIVKTMDFKLKHEVYCVTAGALAINKIDIVKHDEPHCLMPVGHNPAR